MTEEKLQSEVGRAQRAAALLRDDLLIAAFADIETAIVSKWKNSADTAERERLHLMLKLLANLHGVIDNHVTTGKMAASELANIEKRRSFFNRKAQ